MNRLEKLKSSLSKLSKIAKLDEQKSAKLKGGNNGEDKRGGLPGS